MESSDVENGNKTAEVRGALRHAAAFLECQIHAEQLWTACLSSDGSYCPIQRDGFLMCAFFVTQAMHETLSEPDRRTIAARLRNEARGGAWGYSPNAPIDADDTAFALRTLRLLGCDAPLDGIQQFCPPGGAVVTWACRRAVEPSFDLLRDVDPDVLANVYLLWLEAGNRSEIHEHLIEALQESDGAWPARYYVNRFYSTRLYLELLQRMASRSDCARKALRFLRSTQNSDGSWGEAHCPFETALAVAGLATSPNPEPGVESGLGALLDLQTADGAWKSKKAIWTFQATEQSVWKAYDLNRVVTTAVAMDAVKRASMRSRKEG